MNYAADDDVTSEQLRQRYLIAESEEHLLKAAELAELAAENLWPMNDQVNRRRRLRELGSTLRNERAFLRYGD